MGFGRMRVVCVLFVVCAALARVAAAGDGVVRVGVPADGAHGHAPDVGDPTPPPPSFDYGAGDHRDAQYWDDFYAEHSSLYEWYVPLEAVRAEMAPFLPYYDDRILVVGAGTSDLSVLLAGEGYEDVVSIDFSKSSVHRMRKLFPELEWLEMDVRHMDAFPDASVDVVLDKGLLDAMRLQSDPHTIPDALAEVHRVLRPGGRLLIVSLLTSPYGDGGQELVALDWDVRWKRLDVHFDAHGALGKKYFLWCVTKPADESTALRMERDVAAAIKERLAGFRTVTRGA